MSKKVGRCNVCKDWCYPDDDRGCCAFCRSLSEQELENPGKLRLRLWIAKQPPLMRLIITVAVAALVFGGLCAIVSVFLPVTSGQLQRIPREAAFGLACGGVFGALFSAVVWLRWYFCFYIPGTQREREEPPGP